jgi:predicted nucleotidyltransferase
MHAPPDRVFAADEILKVLADHAVEFVVIGGIAVQAHGYLRGTHDLDIVVRSTIVNLSRLAEALAELEAELRVAGKLKLTDPHQLGRAPLIPILTKAGPLDILNLEHLSGGPRSYDALRDAAVEVELEGFEVAIAGLSDLIRMKRAAGRDQDLMDIEALTRSPEST